MTSVTGGSQTLAGRPCPALPRGMKLRGFLIALLLVGIQVVFLPQKAQAQTSPCQDADALLNAALFDEAIAAYKTLLKEASPPPCADQGIQVIVQRRSAARALFAQGEVYEAAGFRDQAVTAYTAARAK